jgi:hypothetical protein
VSDERDKPEGGAEESDKPGEASAEGEERPTVAPPFDPIAFANEILHGTSEKDAKDNDANKEGRKATKPGMAAQDRLPGSASVSSAPPPSQRTPKAGGLSVPPPSGGGGYWFEGPFSPGALQGPASAASSGSGGSPPSPPQGSPSSNPHTKATPAGGFRPPAPTYTDTDALEEARKRSLEIMQRRDTAGALAFVNTTVPSSPPPPNTKPAGPPGPQRAESVSGLNAVDAEWADLEAATRPPPPGQNPEDFDIPSRREPSGLENISKLYEDHAHPQSATTPKAPAVAMPIEREEPPPSGKKTTPPPALVEDPAFLVRAKKKSVREDVPPTEEEMNERVGLGDYTGALDIAEKLLATDPRNAAISSVADNCRTVLRQMYIAKIGPMDRVPIVMVPRDQLRWLSIDHRAGFVLSLVDGVSSLEMILDVSGMPELDALRILTELAQQRIISFR